MKAIITVIGVDQPGIIARVSMGLYQNNINILDSNQTILSGYFTMVMMVDLAGSAIPFEEIVKSLDSLSQELGLEIRIQRSEIFDAMHRL